jgi:hypothetical protein
MPNIINGDNGVVSGSAGLKSSSDGTGVLALQTNGTTAVTVDASQNTTLAGTLTIGTATQAVPSGTAPLYAARAWVNFNGTGTVAIRASGNVTSITDNGTGDYTVNFTTAMSDANYSATITSGYHTVSWGLIYFNAAFTTSACRFITTSPSESDVDNQIVCATFIR